MVTDSIISTGTKCTDVACIIIYAVVLSLVTIDMVRSMVPVDFVHLVCGCYVM